LRAGICEGIVRTSFLRQQKPGSEIGEMKKTVFFLLLAWVLTLLSADLNYNFNYCFQGDIKGTFLLIFPYRVFFMVRGSIDLTGRKMGSDRYRFYYQKAAEPACLIRSVGFSGKYFVVIAAGYDMDSVLVFMVNRINDFKQRHPDYAKSSREFRKLLVHIPPDQQGSIQFDISSDGIVKKHSFHLILKPAYNQKAVDIFFNPFKIMMEFLKAYNHSFLPVPAGEKLYAGRAWQSQPLDFSGNLNGVAWQVAKIIRRYVTFRQKQPFRLGYRIKRADDSGIEIIGESHPDIKVWRRFSIKDFYRNIKLNPLDHTLVEDSIHLEVRDKNGMGGFARATLKLIE
jgi:hypothetical protein